MLIAAARRMGRAAAQFSIPKRRKELWPGHRFFCMFKLFLRLANGLVSLVVMVCLLTAGAYAGYALWDNNRIYAAAENVQADMIQLKPEVLVAVGENEAPSFFELQSINPDVCAWVEMDNTKVDHPVLQGETNLDYINTDVYGNFSLPGSIFLDTRCDRTYHSDYMLLYGHNMENGGMFGSLHDYKNKKFFEENRTGTLIVPDGICQLETFACLLINSYDDIFEPDMWQDNIDGLLDFAENKAMYLHEEVIADMRAELEMGGRPQVLALTTCSGESDDARTVVLTVMSPYWINKEDVTDEKLPA